MIDNLAPYRCIDFPVIFAKGCRILFDKDEIIDIESCEPWTFDDTICWESTLFVTCDDVMNIRTLLLNFVVFFNLVPVTRRLC